jgi:hypothetical protein
VAVRAHPDRRPLSPSAVEERPRITKRTLDQPIGSIGWIASGQGGGSTTSFRAIAVEFDVGDQPAVRQQAQRVQRHRAAPADASR